MAAGNDVGARTTWPVLIATFAWAFAAIAVLELRDLGLSEWMSAVLLGGVSVGIASMVQVGIVGPLRRHAALQAARRRRAESLLEASCRELEVVDSTDRSLEDASSEGEVLDLLRRVTLTALAEHDCHLLLRDSEGAFSHALALRVEGFGTPEPVEAPDSVQASVCVPIRTALIEIGTIRVLSAEGDPPNPAAIRRLERTTRRCATRIAELRAAHAGSDQGQVDPDSSPLELASEVDRETVEHVARNLIARLERFALAVCAIDRADDPLDAIDPAWPTAAADLLGDVLDETLRPTDVIGRTEYSFMLLLPNADAASALAALERVRENLVLRLTELGERPFTASIGVAASTDATDMQSLTLSADLALRMAQRQGGNRVRSWDADAHRDHSAGSARD